MDNMTALVSCFARAYHHKNSERPVFADSVAEKLLTAEEYAAISRNMAQGIQYFAPGFRGTQEEALLSRAGFLIYDHMDADEATEAFFKDSDMTAPAGVGYCLAVRK